MMLFINSLSEEFFSEYSKTAQIIPVFKSGDSNSTANYIPISILPILPKMFEKLMCARLDFYLNRTIIYVQISLASAKISNTSDAIIEFLDYVYSSLDKKIEHSCCISRFLKGIRHS